MFNKYKGLMQKFYKKMESGAPVGDMFVRSNLQYLHPKVDLDDKVVLDGLGYCVFENNQPPANSDKSKEYISTPIEIEEGIWANEWTMGDKVLTDEETAANLEEGFNNLRDLRNYLLSKTDHHTYSDTPEMTAEMITYRQALRDLPASTANPYDVTYPINPDDPDGTKK